MGHGSLNEQQTKAVAQHVAGRAVWDMGAGDLNLARLMLKLGAKAVVAIDKERYEAPLSRDGLTVRQDYFHHLPVEDRDVLFMSWPSNYNTNLLPHVLRARTVIYLGKNTDGTACGTPGIFEVMVRRKLLAYVPDQRNSLVIVGEYLDVPRVPTGEEKAGLMVDEAMLSFTDAESA